MREPSQSCYQGLTVFSVQKQRLYIAAEYHKVALGQKAESQTHHQNFQCMDFKV
jgi:hypothetical protein